MHVFLVATDNSDGNQATWQTPLLGIQWGQMMDVMSNTPVAVSLPAGRTATALALGNSHSCVDRQCYGWYLIVALALTGTGAVDWLRMQGQVIYRVTAIALYT